jgi:Domain of unknown function (DUF4157)
VSSDIGAARRRLGRSRGAPVGDGSARGARRTAGLAPSQVPITSAPPGAAMLLRECSCAKGAAEDQCEDCKGKKLQRAPAAHAPSSAAGAGSGPGRAPGRVSQPVQSAIDGARGGGRPLDVAVRRRLAPVLGDPLADVRVHTDTRAAGLAHAVSARAFAVGSDLFFAAGEYRPGSPTGDGLIAHEAVHALQQRGAPSGVPLTISDPADPLERQAGSVAGTVADGLVGPQWQADSRSGGAPATIARQPVDDNAPAKPIPCFTGNCHEPVRSPTSPAGGAALVDRAAGFGSFGTSDADRALLEQWIAAQGPASQAAGRDSDRPPPPPPVIKPSSSAKTPPGIAALGPRRHPVHVVEVVVPQAKLPLVGSTRAFSQAEVVKQYTAVITEPDPTAGYNFDTYIANASTGQWIPAQHVSGTLFRVFMGTRECPGCHFGQGLVVDLHGQSFVTVLAQGAMDAAMLGDLPALAEGFGARGATSLATREGAETELLAPRPRTPADEFADWESWLQAEGSTGATAGGEPISMFPYGGASRARQIADTSEQAMHGLPRSVGRDVPGYNPRSALTTFGETGLHAELDQPWKDAFQAMRRQGRTTASAQEIYNEVAAGIDGSTQLSAGMKSTLKLRLHDEMFVEYGLQPGQQVTLPYPNIPPTSP